MERGESFGGPPDVPVTRHGRTGPLVRLRHDPACMGRVVREGPSQSIVRWHNGNEDCVVNSWVERISNNGPDVLIPKSDWNKREEPGFVGTGVIVEKKPRKEPDALARRVSEFDDKELKRFAKSNGCWDDKYLQLPNAGLRRMNVMNKLRTKIKHGHEVKWT